MARLTLEITMSLDGFVAGPNQTLEQPLGEGGERLHEWAYGLAAWREPHGLSGGETNSDSELVEEQLQGAAVIVGRALRGEPRDVTLQKRSHLGEAGQVADLHARHEHAATGIDLDQSLLRESAQRLTRGRAPDPESLHQRALVDHRPGP